MAGSDQPQAGRNDPGTASGITDLWVEFSGTSGADEHFSRDAERLVQYPDHPEVQGSFAVENFGNAVLAGQDLGEIRLPQSLLLHAKSDRFDRIGQVDANVLCFITLNQQRP